MIRRAVGFFVIGLCSVLAVRASSAQEPALAVPGGPAPHIKFDSTQVGLGDVVHGQDAVATFTYRNTGDAPLHILSAKPG